MGLTWKLKRSKKGTELTLEGEIAEGTDFAPILARVKQGPVFVDMSRVERFNSVGIREWVAFREETERASVPLLLERCHAAVVAQLNSISNFLGPMDRVLSVSAPYHCESCGAEVTETIQMAELERPELERYLPCIRCGAQMEFDDLYDSYLGFARRDPGIGGRPGDARRER